MRNRGGIDPRQNSGVTLILGMTLTSAALCIAACSSSGPKREPAFDPPFAHSVDDTATRAAIAKPGAKICRQTQIGIAERDWIRGVVTEVAGDTIRVRIEDPGRLPQSLNGTALARGVVVTGSPLGWTPCLF